MAAVQTAFEIFANTIQEVVASLQPVLQKVMDAFQPLAEPSDVWHAHAREGGLGQCPSCHEPVPAVIVESIRSGAQKCPVCNHAGVHELCPVCRGLLISSHAFFNVRERWHCQDCGRQFDDGRQQL